MAQGYQVADDPEDRTGTEAVSRLQDIARTSYVSLGLILALMMSGVLLWFATLRENLEFWRNSGGYPVALRDLVETSFYPLSMANLVSLALLSWALFQKTRTAAALWLVQVVALAVCFSLVAATAVVAFANNVSNLWNGAPLHHHQDDGMPRKMDR